MTLVKKQSKYKQMSDSFILATRVFTTHFPKVSVSSIMGWDSFPEYMLRSYMYPESKS